MPVAHTRFRLRPAIPADAPLLRCWDDEPHVVASDPDDDWQWEEELLRSPPWREQLMVEVDGRPIGFVQIIDPALEDSRYWGDVAPNLRALDIWIGEADALGQGYGTLMMRAALARCFAAPEVEAVLIDPLASNLDAIRFYRRFGFVFVEARDFGTDHCHVHRLARADYTRWLDDLGSRD
jgi:aminoglycoside 6'-N-acetyltransferase